MPVQHCIHPEETLSSSPIFLTPSRIKKKTNTRKAMDITFCLWLAVLLVSPMFASVFRSCCTVSAYQPPNQRLSKLISSSSRKPGSAAAGSVESKRGYRNDNFLQEERDTVVSPTKLKPGYGILQFAFDKKYRSPLSRKGKIEIRSVAELRSAILDQKVSLSEIKIIDDNGTQSTNVTGTVATDFFNNHSVQKLMKERFESKSTPGNRPQNDNATLALSIEGGGMRGCVSAGMVAAIAALGLSDTIDTVYGSSAGSVVGAYFVSRQVCMDVYVDILPAAKKLFVCKTRMFKSLASSLVDVLVSSMRKESLEFRNKAQQSPGMNISFVLDGIMGQDHGIRPLDMEKFQQNDLKQPLRVVSSCIDTNTGRLFSKCFGTEDFFNETAIKKVDGSRQGLFACLEASMTVPVSMMD
jgi:hypothetical protein